MNYFLLELNCCWWSNDWILVSKVCVIRCVDWTSWRRRTRIWRAITTDWTVKARAFIKKSHVSNKPLRYSAALTLISFCLDIHVAWFFCCFFFLILWSDFQFFFCLSMSLLGLLIALELKYYLIFLSLEIS